MFVVVLKADSVENDCWLSILYSDLKNGLIFYQHRCDWAVKFISVIIATIEKLLGSRSENLGCSNFTVKLYITLFNPVVLEL